MSDRNDQDEPMKMRGRREEEARRRREGDEFPAAERSWETASSTDLFQPLPLLLTQNDPVLLVQMVPVVQEHNKDPLQSEKKKTTKPKKEEEEEVGSAGWQFPDKSKRGNTCPSAPNS